MSEKDKESNGAPSPQESPEPRKRFWLFTGLGLFLVFTPLFLVLVAALFYVSTGYGYKEVKGADAQLYLRAPDPLPEGQTADSVTAAAEKQLAKLQPKGNFIVIDRVRNRLYLRNGDQIFLNAVISAGAGSVLVDPRDPSGQKKWVFDTPVGRFYVKGKRDHPTWTAPDWDYIESGEPMPKNYADRVQEGMLGEYALDLAGGPPGYMIHGTLYTRLLGRNVSHGCIRVGRDDLRVVWKSIPVGSSVFMF